MIILQVLVLLVAIFIVIRLGGIAICYAVGLGVVILGLVLGMKPGNIPWDVILIIAASIASISAMQQAGGLDYMVKAVSYTHLT
ncbi:C4-dicarboxylate ABC transporter, partial [Campylobacter jejuni]